MRLEPDSTAHRMLEALEQYGAQSANELANELGVRRQSIEVAMKPLRAHGIVVRSGTGHGEMNRACALWSAADGWRKRIRWAPRIVRDYTTPVERVEPIKPPRLSDLEQAWPHPAHELVFSGLPVSRIIPGCISARYDKP